MTLETFLANLGAVATSPYSFIAYLCVLAAWLLVALRVRRNKNLLDALEKLPENQRLAALQVEMRSFTPPAGLTPEQWLAGRIHTYYFYGFLAVCLCIAALTILALSQTEQLGKTSDDTRTLPSNFFERVSVGTTIKYAETILGVASTIRSGRNDALFHQFAWSLNDSGKNYSYRKGPFAIEIFSVDGESIDEVYVGAVSKEGVSIDLYSYKSSLSGGRLGTFGTASFDDFIKYDCHADHNGGGTGASAFIEIACPYWGSTPQPIIVAGWNSALHEFGDWKQYVPELFSDAIDLEKPSARLAAKKINYYGLRRELTVEPTAEELQLSRAEIRKHRLEGVTVNLGWEAGAEETVAKIKAILQEHAIEVVSEKQWAYLAGNSLAATTADADISDYVVDLAATAGIPLKQYATDNQRRNHIELLIGDRVPTAR